MEEAQFLFSWRDRDSKQRHPPITAVLPCVVNTAKKKERGEKNQGTKFRLQVSEEQCFPSFVTVEQLPDVASCAPPRGEQGLYNEDTSSDVPSLLYGQMHRYSAQKTSACFPFKGKEKKNLLFIFTFFQH